MNIDDRWIADARERMRKKAQNEATCFAISDMLKDAQEEVRRLREENERLRKWIRVEGDHNDTCTRQILGETCQGCQCTHGEIDAARCAKPEPTP